MNALHIAARCALAVVLAVLVAGCSDSATDSSSTSADTPTTEVDFVPPTETTGPESPQPSQNGGPAISVASLPIGGNSGNDGEAQQCAEVNWLGTNPIPHDVSISVDAIGLDPTGVFTFGGDGCNPGTPACTTSWTWAAGAAAQCVVAVTQVVDPPQDVDVQLVMKGTVHCTEQRLCEAAVSGSGGSQITFTAQPGVVSSSSGSSESSSSSSESSAGS